MNKQKAINNKKQAIDFRRACYSYFSDTRLIDWIYEKWNHKVARQLIYKSLSKINDLVIKNPDQDYQADFRNFGDYTIGIDMQKKRIWITNPKRHNPLLKDKNLILLSEDQLFLDWNFTILDFLNSQNA